MIVPVVSNEICKNNNSRLFGLGQKSLGVRPKVPRITSKVFRDTPNREKIPLTP